MPTKMLIFRTLASVLLCLSLSACNQSSSDNKNNAGTTATEYLSSYEVVAGCTTKQKVFRAPSEKDIANAVCSALKDEKLNNNCASSLRKQLFTDVSCDGVFPAVASGNGIESTFNERYAYQQDDCSTGIHFFYASTQAKVSELHCAALKNDELNRNCAKSKREEAFNDNECSKVMLKMTNQKPPIAQQDLGKVEEKKEEQQAKPSAFTCFSDKNVCDESSQYCLISKDAVGNRNTDECLSLPTQCKDDDCISEAAKMRFCKDGNPNNCTDNCKAGIQTVRKGNQLTVTCTGLPMRRF